jgi:hypothetical protein
LSIADCRWAIGGGGRIPCYQSTINNLQLTILSTDHPLPSGGPGPDYLQQILWVVGTKDVSSIMNRQFSTVVQSSLDNRQSTILMLR